GRQHVQLYSVAVAAEGARRDLTALIRQPLPREVRERSGAARRALPAVLVLQQLDQAGLGVTLTAGDDRGAVLLLAFRVAANEGPDQPPLRVVDVLQELARSAAGAT